MAYSLRLNGQIPPDVIIALIVTLGIVYMAGQLSTDQAQALAATGGIAELALLVLRLFHARR